MYKSKLTRKNARKGFEKYKFKLKMEKRNKEIKSIQEAETEFNRQKLLRKSVDKSDKNAGQ